MEVYTGGRAPRVGLPLRERKTCPFSVIYFCLREIHRCRPFLYLSLLGKIKFFVDFGQ